MALSPHADWTAAFSKAVIDKRVQVNLRCAGMSSDAQFCNALGGSYDGLNPSLVGVSSYKRAIDPIERTTTLGDVSLTFALDPEWRDIITSYGLKGARVEVLLGEVSTSQQLSVFKGRCVGYEIEPLQTAIKLKCQHAASKLSEREVFGGWVNMHPLQVAEDILQQCGYTSDTYDASTFDPSLYTERSHLVVSRPTVNDDGKLKGSFTVEQPTIAADLIGELMLIMNGRLVSGEDGKLRFVQFDPSVAAVTSLTEDDFDLFEQMDPTEGLINRVTISGHTGYKLDPEEPEVSFSRNDTASQARYGYHESGTTYSDGVFEFSRVMKWCNGTLYLTARTGTAYTSLGTKTTGGVWTAASPAAGATYWIGNWPSLICTISGTRLDTGSAYPTIPATAQISASRLLYLLIDGEIVSFDAISYPSNFKNTFHYDAYSGGELVDTTAYASSLIGLRVYQRGALGTTAGNHCTNYTGTDALLAEGQPTHDTAFDITPLVMVANDLSGRWGNGAFGVKLSLPLRFAWLQEGDFVTVQTNRHFIALGKSSLSTSDKFEIVSKNVDIEKNVVEVELVIASFSSPPATAYSTSFAAARTRYVAASRTALLNDMAVTNQSVLAGVSVSPTAGLAATILSGVIGSTSATRSVPDTSVTLEASKENHIYLDTQSGAVRIEAVTAGSPVSDKGTTETKIAVATTGATTISSLVDTRDFSLLSGIAVKESTLGSSRTINATEEGANTLANSSFMIRTRTTSR